jgi:hypothetical protein
MARATYARLPLSLTVTSTKVSLVVLACRSEDGLCVEAGPHGVVAPHETMGRGGKVPEQPPRGGEEAGLVDNEGLVGAVPALRSLKYARRSSSPRQNQW